MQRSANDIDFDEVLDNGMFSTTEDFTLTLGVIRDWDEQFARDLIRSLLMSSGSLGIDEHRLESALRRWDKDSLREGEAGEYRRRLVLYEEDKEAIEKYHRRSDDSELPVPTLPWEGINWVLDLLQDSPHQALQVVEAYMETHFYVLPDGRLKALEDAAALIRARYVGLPEHTEDRIALLLDRHPRDLEILTARLYRAMGYDVVVTKRTGDDGRDIIATRDDPGRREHLRIECKRWDRTVGVAVARSLLGVLSHEKVGKGVIVTTSGFSRPARKLETENPRLELMSGKQLVLLLNEHLGFDWPLHIERFTSRPPAPRPAEPS